MNKWKDLEFMETVAELNQYLQQHGLSPEELAREVKISNMTIRRLLKKPSSTLLPERYRLLLTLKLGQKPDVQKLGLKLHAAALGEIKPFLRELEEIGRGAGGVPKLKHQIKSKIAGKDFSGTFCSALVQQLVLSASSRTLPRALRYTAIGALVYFINPFDFIPDAMVSIGYLDDFAVLSLVSELITELPPVDWT